MSFFFERNANSIVNELVFVNICRNGCLGKPCEWLFI